MLAVDTNVVVRYLTRDEPRQAGRAKKLVDNSEVFVALTVLLETEWVLRRGYRMTGEQVIEALTNSSDYRKSGWRNRRSRRRRSTGLD